MQKKKRQNFVMTGVFMLLFVVFTILTKMVDVQPIGPENSNVGFAAINRFVHEATGVNMIWYQITEWFGVLAILTAFFFAAVGLIQLVQGKSLRKVDESIIALGIFYILTAVIYVFFEKCIVNYRPILMDGILEASYPSSHTMMVTSLLGAAIIESGVLIKNKRLHAIIKIVLIVIIIVTVVGRLISGVHWFTDIVGGIFISSALLMGFYSVISEK